jgi:hypothetical protein
MPRFALAIFALAAFARADGFTFVIGSPVAAQDFAVKSAAFAVRTEGCADSARLQVSGTAEGLVKGMRRSAALRIMPASRPGVYAVFQTWPPEGQWVANLKGTCGAASAGAVVPIGARGFIRESSKFFPRPATDAEIEASLKTLTEGGNK